MQTGFFYVGGTPLKTRLRYFYFQDLVSANRLAPQGANGMTDYRDHITIEPRLALAANREEE
ncbi:MAG: hypothetical protein IAF00_00435 [Phycisphaerales bacterium]|nr:hypothetical protein [Phycisphaerales bacterium]